MEDHADLTQPEDSTVLELLDRLLNQGVVLCGDLAISVADIDLIYARLQLTLSSVETARRAGWYVPTLRPSARQPERQRA
jgi:hypothetical protein